MRSDILNLLPYPIYWIQAPTKKILGCNRQFLAAHNYVEASEITGKSIDTVFSGEYLKLIDELLEKNINAEKKSVIYFDSLDSSQEPLLIQCSYSSSEATVIFSEMYIDAKNLYKALWEEKEKIFSYLDNIVEYIPASVYLKDKNSVILGGSQLHAEIAGVSDRKEVVGKSDYEFIWKKQAELIIKNDQLVMNNNESFIFEETAKLRDGGIHTFLTKKSPLKDKLGGIIGVLGVSLDITELKETQSKLEFSLKKAEVANQAKTEFLENMRHDLRTPLSGIVGCAQLIQIQADNPKKVAEYAEDLVQSSNTLLEFLNKILESIQVATGEIPLLKKRFDLYKALEQIIRLNKPQADIKHLKLHLDYDKAIPTYLLGDPVRVQRIILELLTNALKFTDAGEIKVTAHLMKNRTRTEKLIIKLSVSDTGMGIPSDQQHKVYTRFTRLTPSYKGIYPGTGLGLSVVKQFIDDLGGEIHLDSQPNQGSTFTCLIPLQESLSTPQESETEEAPLPAGDNVAVKKTVKRPEIQEMSLTTGSRVLVVEDNPIAAKVAQAVLLNLNCQTDIAADGKTALTYTEKNHYDLILIDIGLPDGDGCDVTRRIRLKQWQRNPSGQRNPSVPILGLTANISEEKKRDCLKNGMNAIYTKPLTTGKVSEILNAFLTYPQSPIFKENDDKSPDISQSLPILDKDQALAYLGSKQMFHQMLALIESSLTKELADLKQHHLNNDWPAIRALAHKCKGWSELLWYTAFRESLRRDRRHFDNREPFDKTEELYQQLLQVAEETKAAAKNAVDSES